MIYASGELHLGRQVRADARAVENPIPALRGTRAPFSVNAMSAIEAYLRIRLEARLHAAGVPESSVSVRSAEAENWRYRITAGGRVFEMGFSHREPFWARETTPGREKALTSNDHPPAATSAEALERGVRLVALTVRDPAFPPRDPPLI